MSVDTQLFIQALENVGFDHAGSLVKVTDKSLEFLREVSQSAELIEFLRQFSFRSEVDFGGVFFEAVNRIRAENLNEVNKELFKQRLLILGSGMNGDPIVLNTATMTLGFVFHDALWENDRIEDPSQIYVDMNMSIGQFFYRSTTEENFPIDAYDAKEFIE